ncbi:LysR substrate-binding domain-containing protein [Novosphingobium album (ex Hu et al. 2023)]|uniref:LysR substrate-binding domain-containing protein n=1 Tax=Novosphingobium album (ex Hu et al. 2023) TaxID=2930093 RepID=A0ABT0AWI4_9SPHN|nr:LysR substrate-binding domain-containing protein [Novosphingobium album (ex Hu et al. 2023)]MCJ2177169.1 LysR substrate-binding domain-containing protein [Novosphingobium album (ex Hu et al. 2023)]
MSLLCAFEAAARLESFTAAAAELHLTQGAVSRQIRALEETLGAPLFHRERQQVRLTVAGESYAGEIREALKRISTATLGFRANPRGGTLNLAILPTFGIRWLAPRLPAFQAEHPGITINLQTRLNQFDFNLENFDAAIHFGSDDWPGAETALLMRETVVPACSAAMRDSFELHAPADLTRPPLLHLSSRPDAWEQWFAINDVTAAHTHGMLLDQFALAAQAASSGLGVALLPKFLIEQELASGELVMAFDRPMISKGAYFLAWPSTRDAYPPLRAFRGWLVEEAGMQSSLNGNSPET